MTPSELRDSQIKAAVSADQLRKLKRNQATSIASMMDAVAVQIPSSVMALRRDRVDFNGSGKFETGDYQSFQNEGNVVNDWQESTAAPTSIAAAVTGTTVEITWQNNGTRVETLELFRDGQLVIAFPGPIPAGYRDTNVAAGSHSYTLRASNNEYQGLPSAAATATVQGTVPPPTTGWTEFVNIEAKWYVADTGSDSNPGTQASPFKTLAKGYSMLRDGHRDWMYAKKGDTFNESLAWNKGAGSTGYCGFGAYGTGPRPKLRTSGTGIDCGRQAKRGVAFVGIDLMPTGTIQSGAGILAFCPWGDMLVEDCSIVGYPVNLCFQEVQSADRATGLKIRRNVLCDSKTSGGGHSQGCFQGANDNWLQDGNYAINNGQDGTIFSHGFYDHETNGPGTFKDNVCIRNGSHGAQVRPGGVVDNNLFLKNSVNLYVGGGGTNTITRNSAIGGKDISAADPRGIAFVFGGGAQSIAEYNIAAHNKDGTAALAFNWDGWNGKSIKACNVWDWTDPTGAGWNTGHQHDGGSGTCAVTDCIINMPNNGMIHRMEGRSLSGLTFARNTYWTSTPDGGVGGYTRFSVAAGQGVTLAGWRSATGDQSTFLSAPPAAKDLFIGAYLSSIGIVPGSDPVITYESMCRKQSRDTWDERITANSVNTWIRATLGGIQPPLTPAP